MQARHLFIMMDAFQKDDQVTGGAKGLALKFGTRAQSCTLSTIDGQNKNITSEGSSVVNSQLANGNFPNRVGVYLITHMNMPFHLAGADKIAELICSYLDGFQSTLAIDHTMLDKFVLASCVGSEGLKENFMDPAALSKMNALAQKPDKFYKSYMSASPAWDAERQKALDEATKEYQQDPDKFLGASDQKNTMMLLACAFDRRGAHPKIAAWDSSLYVNTDGSKSIHGVNQGNVFRHQRLKYKMMLQFHRSSSSGGSIRQLGLQDWSDKPLNLPKG